MSHEHSVNERVQQAAKLFGLSVRVTNDPVWEVHDGVITVGTGFYPPTQDGAALTAMVCLDLWAGAILPRNRHRTRLRTSLTHEQPWQQPLLSTIDRFQAAGELIAAFPAFYTGLAEFFRQHLGGNIRNVPETEQLLAALTVTLLSPDTRLRLNPAVREQLNTINIDALRLACTPLTPPDPVRTYRRILALLLPLFEAPAHDQGHGLTHAGEQPLGDAAEDELLDIGFGGGDDPHAAEQETGDADQATAADDDPARKGNSADTAEGADLFEAKQAGEVSAVLDTPLPGDGAQALTNPEQTQHPVGESRERDLLDTGGEALTAEQAHTRAGLGTYLTRVRAHAESIDRLAEVWLSLTAERLTSQPRDTRTPFADGDRILMEALPAVVAKTRVGVATPEAYTRRYTEVRERDDTGNTDIVFLIDRSGSMQHVAAAAADAAAVMMEALAEVTRELERELREYHLEEHVNIRSSLIVFDAGVHVVKPLAAGMNDTARVRLFHEALRIGGGTNDAAALDEAAHQLGLTAGGTGGSGGVRRRVVIVVSDGGSSDLAAAEASLRFLRARNVHVFGVGVGPGHMASRYAPDGRNIHEARDMVNVFEELLTTEMGWSTP